MIVRAWCTDVVIASLAAAMLVGVAAAPARAVSTADGGIFIPVPSVRLVDTRISLGATLPGPRGIISVPVLDRARVPASGVSAVVLNVTVPGPTVGGHLTVWAHGTPRPATWNLSFSPQQTVAGSVVAQVGDDGEVAVYNGARAATQLVVDMSGYYTSGTSTVPGGFVAVTPVRAVDTRVALGARTPGPDGTIDVGMGTDVPKAAAVLQVTAVHPTAVGYLSMHARSSPRPTASTLDFSARQTVSNLDIVPLDSDGEATIDNRSAGHTPLVVDIIGYYTAGTPTVDGAFRSTPATRLMDTRIGQGRTTPHGHLTIGLNVLGVGGLPTAGVSTVVLNVTVTAADANGYLKVFPYRSSHPGTSNVNFTAHHTVANLVVVPVGANGVIDFDNVSVGSTPLIADLEGYTLATSPPPWTTPNYVAPRSGGVTAVSCPSPTFCAMLDVDGNALTFNGTAWTVPANVDVNSGGSAAMSCPTADFCEAVDKAGNALTFDGRTWTLTPGVDTVGSPSAISCTSSTFCIMLDARGYYARYDGTWSAPARVGPGVEDSPQSVSCATTSFCIAMTDNLIGNQVYRYTGTSWIATVRLDDKGGGPILAVSCPSATFCMAINYQFAYTYDGHTWSAAYQLDDEQGVQALSCAAPSFCVVIVDGSPGFYYQSGTWVRATRVEEEAFGAVSCASSIFCMATADTQAVRFDGSSWTASTIDPTTGPELLDVSCASRGFCLAVSDKTPLSLIYNGTRWRARPAPAANYLAHVDCVSPRFCVAADEGYVLTYNGRTWSARTPIGPGAVSAVSCFSTTFCVAVGYYAPTGRNFFSTFDGTQWSPSVPIAADPTSVVATVVCTSTTFCASLGDHSGLTFNGTTWTKQPDFAGGWSGAAGLDCVSDSFCAALDTNGDATFFDGTSWSTTYQALSNNIGSAISCGSTSDCIAVSTAGTETTYNGTSWSSPVTIDANGYLRAVSCPSSSFCLAIDQSGHAVHTGHAVA